MRCNGMGCAMQMEVGIEDCLHIEFEYSKSKYNLKDVVIGKIFFLLVRIRLKHMELEIRRRESTGSGPNTYNESETLAKYEIMDGCPVRGQCQAPSQWLCRLASCWLCRIAADAAGTSLQSLYPRGPTGRPLLLEPGRLLPAAPILAATLLLLAARMLVAATVRAAVLKSFGAQELRPQLSLCHVLCSSGESIPVRLFLSPYDLTPTYRNINNKFSVKYFLNLVLVDEEDRRYFKQQEIVLFRGE